MVTSGQVLTLKTVKMVFFNADKAKTEFNKAKEALQAQGVQFPIHLDLPVDQAAKPTVATCTIFENNLLKRHSVKKMWL